MRSRRGTLNRLAVLIDTSFLLPALGVGIEEEAERVIPLFRKINVYYLEAGLLEAMWKILKIANSKALKRVEVGIDAIRKTYNLASPPPEAYVEAAKIYRAGHRDYIDALHYSTAKALNLKLLTIDRQFIEFLLNNRYEVEKIVITPERLKQILHHP